MKGSTPQLDLHGLRHHIAEKRLEQFLGEQIRNGTDSVLVIHGHGSGVMRELAYEWITNHGNKVADHESRNNGGAVYIRLKRR